MKSHRDVRGFAILGVIIAILIIAALGGGAYYAAQRAEMRATTTAVANADTTLRALLARGEDITCTFSHSYEGGASQGVVFVADGKMRGDFTSTVEGQGAVASHMINDGEYAYVWSDAAASQGMKMKVDAMANANANANAQGQAALDYDQALSYDCDDWNEDDEKFELPSGVAFTDFTSMINAAASSSAAANANLGAGASANVGAGANVNADASACASCDSLPDAAKSQCRVALSC
jgi:hypothetical protein